MANQPNLELTPDDRPIEPLDTEAPRRESPRPGAILAPDQKPEGPAFGTPGPDTGYALRILAKAEVADDAPRLRRVLAGLMGARAAHFGRAPTPEDMNVALLLAGLGRHESEELDRRRQRWVEAAAHERSPGRAAIAEIGGVLYQDPEHVDLLTVR